MDTVKETIRQFVLSTHLKGEEPDTLRDDTPLQTSGILDSLATLGLVTFIEQKFAVELDIYDTSVDQFDTLDDIAATVARKQSVRGVPIRRSPNRGSLES
jgi:acyl carrier protein